MHGTGLLGWADGGVGSWRLGAETVLAEKEEQKPVAAPAPLAILLGQRVLGSSNLPPLPPPTLCSVGSLPIVRDHHKQNTETDKRQRLYTVRRQCKPCARSGDDVPLHRRLPREPPTVQCG